MNRRDFLCTSIAASALSAVPALSQTSDTSSCNPALPKAAGVTQHIADFVLSTQYSDIPPEVIELGKKSILDGLGLAIYSATGRSWEILHRYFSSFAGGAGDVSVLGTNVRLPSRFAALSNGIAIHAEDFDDTQLATHKDRVYGLLTHPTAPVLPAALAKAELLKSSGKNLMLGYHLGVEVECKMAEAIAPRCYEDGFHSTGVFGVFGSVAACARLSGFDLNKTLTAFGIAGSQASGLRENFGTMMKPFHAGHAAEAGIVSADLAELGWTASEKILETPQGFFHAYGGTYDLETMMQTVGKPWTFSSPGVSIKPFPSGSLTHPAMSELLSLMHQHNIHADNVESVEVGTNKNMPNALIHHDPKTALQAKFSMEFCLAILLVEGKAGLPQFTDAVVNRPDVREMMRRVHFVVSPEAEAAGYDKMTSILKIKLKDGQIITGRADFAKGSPSNPMSFDEVTEKFLGCAEGAKWPVQQARKIVDLVRHLENLPDVTELILLCRPAKA